ncbi:hypothetical protein RMR16_024785 (plasmid) [Agrobacterium sp. rho-13.3]|uniref:hypothetical protein n=1 Tax=Agrobacterium sp. rho-13.3 TaxID=3072980 RepID=UPI002A17A867|nr:hypothetical protein [Agrobacterium sp. rho-13.3]MDX8310169.1 hypothetical protein [Agrobacterium sp. rho-13.3]
MQRDTAERKRKAEDFLGQPVLLVLDTRDYVVKSRSDPRVSMQAVLDLLPTAKFRADKIGENAEILFMKSEDLTSRDLDQRKAKLEELVGKQVYLRTLPE